MVKSKCFCILLLLASSSENVPSFKKGRERNQTLNNRAIYISWIDRANQELHADINFMKIWPLEAKLWSKQIYVSTVSSFDHKFDGFNCKLVVKRKKAEWKTFCNNILYQKQFLIVGLLPASYKLFQIVTTPTEGKNPPKLTSAK
jgi:hypothetical protein